MNRALLLLSREVIAALLEMQIRPPARNCSCHISPPCNDCVDYGGLREAMKDAHSTVDDITAALAQPEPLTMQQLFAQMPVNTGLARLTAENIEMKQKLEAAQMDAQRWRKVIAIGILHMKRDFWPDELLGHADDAEFIAALDAMTGGQP